MRARLSTLLVGILATLPLAIVWFAFVISGSTLGQVQTEHAKDVFRATTGDVADLTAHYLVPIASAADRTALQLSSGVVAAADVDAIDGLFRTTLETEPSVIAIAWYGADGSIHEMRRDGSRLVASRFDPAAAEPVVTTTWRTTSGSVVSETSAEGSLTVPDSALLAESELAGSAVSDPRLGADGTTQTVTFAASSTGTTPGTVFVETNLAELGRFIAPYAPSASSRLFIVAGADLIAHARPELIDRAPAGSAVLTLPDEPTRLAGGYALGGDGWQIVEIDGETYHAVTKKVDGPAGALWTVVTVGPEDDFSGDFIGVRRADSLKLGLIALAAILLALPLARFAVRDVGSLHTAAHRDSLTGLLNRRTFEKAGAALITAARRRRRSVGALMVDIDHFKQLNDTYGHHAGDEILEAVAGRISHSVAKTDLVARLGGDEMALLLEGADLVASRSVANRLKNVVTATPISTNRGPIYVTVSIGASATGTMDRARLDDLLKAADRALYASKRAGRDRITAVEVARTH